MDSISIYRLLNPKIVRACVVVLSDWEQIPTKSLKAAVTILHRIAYGCSCPAMLYQVSEFTGVLKITFKFSLCFVCIVACHREAKGNERENRYRIQYNDQKRLYFRARSKSPFRIQTNMAVEIGTEIGRWLYEIGRILAFMLF